MSQEGYQHIPRNSVLSRRRRIRGYSLCLSTGSDMQPALKYFSFLMQALLCKRLIAQHLIAQRLHLLIPMVHLCQVDETKIMRFLKCMTCSPSAFVLARMDLGLRQEQLPGTRHALYEDRTICRIFRYTYTTQAHLASSYGWPIKRGVLNVAHVPCS